MIRVLAMREFSIELKNSGNQHFWQVPKAEIGEHAEVQ
jgi:hypothetical protein